MKRRRDQDVFDEPTTPYDPGSVPVPMEIVDDDVTRPVAADELEVAAKASCDVHEPHDPRSMPRARTAAHAQPRPFVELLLAGAGAVLTLPMHRMSATGLVLTVPPGTPCELTAETPVTAVVHLMRGAEEVTRARLPAHVAHHRNASASKAGGLSLRWDLSDPGARRAVEALLAVEA